MKPMNAEKAGQAIEAAFRKQVRKDQRVRNACLLVDCAKAGLHLNLAEGTTDGKPANPGQPHYMASCGKLFTSTLISILYEQGKLSFGDQITKYLDKELTQNLHVYKGADHTNEIRISHLLKQTSGLPDNFWPLLDKLIADPGFAMSPKDAVLWTKDHAKPYSPPGKKLHYTDTNYHLLGLIIESITGLAFHEALSAYIFRPLNMKHSWMLHYSEPYEKPAHPMANFYWNKIRMNDIKGFAGLDFAGGGVVAPPEDLLIFMKALVEHRMIKQETLELMKTDKAAFNPGIAYGYGIWQFNHIPILMPRKFHAWGVAGATGAFMFYHPERETYIIGNFNHSSYQRKGLNYMLFKVVNKLFI